MKRLLMTCFVLGIAGTSPALADCGVVEKLRDQNRSLSNSLGVSKRDAAMIQSFGIPQTQGGFGTTRVRRSDALAALEASGCDPTLERWILSKASHPRNPER